MGDRINSRDMTIEEGTCAVALLYQKRESSITTNKVRGCLVTKSKGDDEYDLKAKAERYFAHKEGDYFDLKGYSIVAWDVAEPLAIEMDE